MPYIDNAETVMQPTTAQTTGKDGGLKDYLCDVRRNLDGATTTAVEILSFLVGGAGTTREPPQSADCMMEEAGMLCSQSEMLHILLDKIASVLGIR